MYANTQAKAAYGQSGPALHSDSEIEYKLFAKVTSALARAKDLPQSEFSQLVSAVHDNQRLWTVLGTDVASPDNELSADLRAQLFYLFEFTLHHSAKVLDGDATVDALIDVNRSVMRGLSGTKVQAA